MFWNNVASLYDIFQKVYNGKTNKKICIGVMNLISKDDYVLECACGTGMITEYIATKCKNMIATDYAPNMIKVAKRKCKSKTNIQYELANITKLNYSDNTFDKVVAANVIHLLDYPYDALKELSRVCKPDGEIIIPTYITKNTKSVSMLVKLWNKLGANFKLEFDEKEYKEFFSNPKVAEITDISTIKYKVIEGKIPSCIAVIKNNK